MLIGLVVGGVLLADALGVVPLRLSLLGVLVALGALVLVSVQGIEALGIGFLLLALLTATWNGLSGVGYPVTPLALAAALVVLVPTAVARRRRLAMAPWVWVLTAAVVATAAAAAVWPADPAYLAGRTQVPIPDAVAARIPDYQTGNALNTLAWLIAVLALPLTVTLALRLRSSGTGPGPCTDSGSVIRTAGLFADVWAVGATVNALVAVTDKLGLTSISARLVPVVDIGGRQAGLGAQPNHLALAVALVAPVVTWRLLTARGPARLVWAAAGVVLLGGVALSGSRGGLVAAALGAAATILVLRDGRRLLVPLVGIGTAAAVLLLATAPQLVTVATSALRLSGDQGGVQESNAIRAQIAAQALHDFASSPVRGIGLPVVVEGHNIYLQLLAAGGAMLFLGFLVAMAGFVLQTVAVSRTCGELPRVLAVCTAVWLLVGLVENQLTDVFLYVPFAIVAGLGGLPRPASTRPSAPLVVEARGGPS